MDVTSLRYKPGWSFKRAGPRNRYLCIFATTTDSNAQGRTRCTQHQFEMPVGVSDREWIRWVRDCLIVVETHEVGEFLAVEGHRPFMPYHQDEGSPYAAVERWEGTPWHSTPLPVDFTG